MARKPLLAAAGYKAGERVQIAPHYDAWMQGDRFGAIVRFRRSVNRERVIAIVRMDRSSRDLHIDTEDLTLCA